MAAEFKKKAAELLQQLPREQSPTDPCPICRESYGTIIPETGISEPAVRLPCFHVMGLECISIWVTSESFRNQCPVCRGVIFKPVDPDDGTVADQALRRLAEREPSWTLDDLRAYLRRRLEPDPPSTEAEVEEWWRNERHLNSHPELFKYRRRMSRFMRTYSYVDFLSRGHQIPPLNPSTSPSLLPTSNMMDESHHNAHIAILEGEDAFDHRFWQATTRGASSREIYDLLRHETYVLGEGNTDFSAPILGGWTGFLNDGRHRVRYEAEGDERTTWNGALRRAEIEEREAAGNDPPRHGGNLYESLWRRIRGRSAEI